MVIQNDEILQVFLEESLEHLANVESDFLAIEADGARINKELVDKVYRAAHSIKGGAGFMGLTNIKDLTHEMENIIGKIRSGEIIPNPDIVNVLLSASDTLKALMKDILNSNDVDIGDHVRALQAILEAGTTPSVKTPRPSGKKPAGKPSPPRKKKPSASGKVAKKTGGAAVTANVPSGDPLSLNFTDGHPGLAVEAETADVGPDRKSTKREHETSLRVHVSLLDQLMTLAGELVLSRNQLLQSMASSDKRGAEVAGQRIDLITSELQEAIMLTRMQSIGNVFNKFPRVVRDLARSLGKQVELSLEGQDVELDKAIIEAIGDPLTHLVRNAVDHGIELPGLRKAAGKSPVGQIFLRAYHEAGQVNIEITDDGRGLDGNQIAAKAVEKGLISEEQAKAMSAREKANLIFLPGFSTADKITDISGRGVGMDVVRANLDQLVGMIDIDSTLGKGTTIRIKLPLTLAIIPCQIVVTGGERYAIPQVNLEELLRIPANQVSRRIERVGNADVVRLRGNLLPLIRLADIIGAQSLYTDPATGETRPDRRAAIADRRSPRSPMRPKEDGGASSADEAPPVEETARYARHAKDRRYHAAGALNIVVVSTGALKYGLVVHHLLDSEEIVVKPLGRDLKKCKAYAGATIMGDGRVALILDVSNLAKMSGLKTVEGTTRAAEVAVSELEENRAARDKQSLLVFRGAENEQFAAPLSLVERIEKIKRTDIEQVSGMRVIKYRGGTLPLFSVDQVATVGPLAEKENLLVVVFAVGGREIGLLAIGPVDAVEINLDIDGTTLRQTGIMGSAIINDHTTLLVDIFEIVQTLNPRWFSVPEQTTSSGNMGATILFAEDSGFFRHHVKGSMEKEGFRVIEAEDGMVAWDLLNQDDQTISLVVTDIEMPNMDGFTLTRKIKENPNYAHLPVIALTTLAGEEDIAKGKAVGIDDYLIKLDRESLIRSIHGLLQTAA